MLVCDACDKGYHTFCLQPAMDSLPSDPWKCRVSHSPLYREMPLPHKLVVKAESLQNMLLFTKIFERDIVTCASLIIWFTFYPYCLYYARGVVCVRSVVSVDLCCQVRPSGLTTMPCVRAASVTAALRVGCAAKLLTHLSLCSAAPFATG